MRESYQKRRLYTRDEMIEAESKKHAIETIRSEVSEGMKQAKCRKCGCMKEALEQLESALSALQPHVEGSLELLPVVGHGLHSWNAHSTIALAANAVLQQW